MFYRASVVALLLGLFVLNAAFALDAKDTAAATADELPIHEISNVIILAPDQLSLLRVPDDQLKTDHANYDPFLRSLYFDHDPDGPNPGELLQAQAMKQEKRGPGALLDKDNTVPDNHVSNAWENVFPRAIKRRAAGKLCYINPIACFGRRQRHA